jgi:molybdate transport system ATP-binding protein
MPQSLFSLSQLGLAYRARPVLRGIDWQWQQGQHWAVLGPNGAGKTALASVLSGEQQHFSGRYERSDLLREAGVAYVCFERGRRLCERDRKLDCAEFESDAVDAGTRVADLLGNDPGQATERQRVVDLLGLAPILERGLRFISTGEMRKTLLASALLQHPALLILDSPLDGLDRAMQAQLGEALEDIIHDSTATLLLCRDPAEIPAACTDVLLLDRGRVAACGARDAVLAGDACRELLAAPALALSALPVASSPARRHSQTSGASATGAASTVAPDVERAPADPPPTLELHGVSVHFGEHCVFRDLDWTLQRGQHCLISGPNGSGKSTLLDLLTGDNHKAYGQDLRFFGRRRGSGESVWEIKALFGRVDARMQFAIPAGCTVLDAVNSGFFDSLGLYDRPSDQQRGHARAWLRALDLESLATQEFQTLSFGLQRLVLLARAMVKAPPLLLMDEATLGLDGGHRRLLLAALDHVIAHSDSQLLFVSHSAGEIPRCINQWLCFEARAGGSRILQPPLEQLAALRHGSP